MKTIWIILIVVVGLILLVIGYKALTSNKPVTSPAVQAPSQENFYSFATGMMPSILAIYNQQKPTTGLGSETITTAPRN